MKNNFFTIIFTFILIFIATLLSNTNNEVIAEEGGIYLKPVEHKLQNPEIQSWFDLDTSKHKGKTIELEVELSNSAKDSRTVILEGTNVITVQNGGLDFVDEPRTEYTGITKDKVALLGNMDGLPKKVTLKGGEETTVKFKIDVPKDEGQFLAGIAYIDDDGTEDTAEEEVESGGSVQVKQQVRFATTILMTNSKEPNKELKIKGTKIELDRGSPRILIDIENDNSMMESSSLHYLVKKKGTEEKVFSGETNGFLMAPFTYIEYPVNWSGDLASGDYEIEITVKQKFGDEIKEIKERFDFNIKEKEIKNTIFPDDTRVIYQPKTPWWVWPLLGGVAFIIILLFRRKKDENEKGNEIKKEQVKTMKVEKKNKIKNNK